MERDIKKCLDEYDRFIDQNKYRHDKFNTEDLIGLSKSANGSTWLLVYNALKVGFMVGYKCAKRENQRQLKTVKVG